MHVEAGCTGNVGFAEPPNFISFSSDTDPIRLLIDATFEKMGALMAENAGRLLGMFDELSSFLTKIKLYSSRGLTDPMSLPCFLSCTTQYHGPGQQVSPKVTFGFSLVNSLFLVTGEANFSMPSTSLTVGGFNQPSVVRNLIELPVNAEKGLSQRFLWLFPKPVYCSFDSLEPIDKAFTTKIGTV